MQETSKRENIKELIKETICEMKREEEIAQYLRLKDKILDYKKRLKIFIICLISLSAILEIKVILSNQFLNIVEQIYPTMFFILSLGFLMNYWILKHSYEKIISKPIEDIGLSDIKKLDILSKM